MSKYANDYSNQSLNIPSDIWNDSTVNGIQKMMLALYKKLTHNGSQSTDILTRIQARILSTHEGDIQHNLGELLKKGYITVHGDIYSKTKISLCYTYRPAPPEPKNNSTSGLFDL